MLFEQQKLLHGKLVTKSFKLVDDIFLVDCARKLTREVFIENMFVQLLLLN